MKLKKIKLFYQLDKRGNFIKFFEIKKFKNFIIKEIFVTKSKQNTLRGFHFQTGKFKTNKLIFCQEGKVLDVVIDLRKKKKTFGKIYSFILDSKIPEILSIPYYYGHAFFCLSKQCKMIYLYDNNYNINNDTGILWNSLNFKWPSKNIIISKRDQKFQSFADYFKKKINF
jgi:dTDP-4-dehydrorhamnose 3,5-epimerase